MELRTALKELADMIKAEIMRRVWEEGVNPKTGTNTLIYSDMIKEMKVEPISDDTIVFQIASYYEYVVLGWRRTHRFEGTFTLFLKNILDWMRRKNVHSTTLDDNRLAWAITMSIMNKGIMPRPFINYSQSGDVSEVLPFLDEFFDKWADDIFEKILTNINKWFDQ